jgi:hypothetical protein
MKRMSRTFVAIAIGAIVFVPVGLVARALDFGPAAWFGVFLAMMFFTSLLDREGFYGPRGSR